MNRQELLDEMQFLSTGLILVLLSYMSKSKLTNQEQVIVQDFINWREKLHQHQKEDSE